VELSPGVTVWRVTRHVRHHNSLEAFLGAAHHLYRADPVLFCTELGILAELAAAPRPALLITVHDAGDLTAVGAALRPLAYPLLTSGLGDDDARLVARFLADHHIAIPGLLGSRSSAEAFAAAWRDSTAARPGICTYETVYRLDALQPPRPVPGAARITGRSDRPLLVDWLGQFHAEAFGRPVDQTSTSAFLAQVTTAGSQFIVWHVAATPVSLARVHPAVNGVARIGPIFTPARERRRGYGAAITAAAVDNVVHAGATEVVLQTDVDNATSNALYQRLGFKPIAASVQMTFTATAAQDEGRSTSVGPESNSATDYFA
jgi:GNAT superfamily N-acetyltransferase